MQIYNSTNHISPCPCVLALGCFDGVHLGHKEVIHTAKDISLRMNIPLTVFTFEEPPRNFFAPTPVPIITTHEEKACLLEREGVDSTVMLPLSDKIFSVSAQSFIDEIMIDKLHAVHIVCGFNYTFGAGGLGNTALLIERCAERGVSVSVVPEYKIDGQAVSSSAIRQAVADGDMRTAARLLGRPYALSSVVIDGQHLARQLDFPTANIIPQEKALLPRNGVYATKMRFDGKLWNGITNIGMRPTVDTHILCAETHVFDFDGDLYGKRITVEFIEFIRGETKFSDLDALSRQVQKDISVAKNILIN